MARRYKSIVELYAGLLVSNYQGATRKIPNSLDCCLLKEKMQQLRSGKFKWDLGIAEWEGHNTISTDEVIGALCEFGETELVAYVLEDLKEHGYIASEEEL